MNREEFVAGLRETADFFESHPGMEIPWPPFTFNVFADSKEDLLARVKAIGGKWDKQGNGDYFYLTRQIGCFTYEININRAKVCRKIVTGTHIEEKVVEDVEWVCDDAVLHADVEAVQS